MNPHFTLSRAFGPTDLKCLYFTVDTAAFRESQQGRTWFLISGTVYFVPMQLFVLYIAMLYSYNGKHYRFYVVFYFMKSVQVSKNGIDINAFVVIISFLKCL